MSDNAFRLLTKREMATIEALAERGRIVDLPPASRAKLTVRYDHDGNFTTALVKHGREIISGPSKRNPDDKFNPEAGEARAFHRALIAGFGPKEEAASA